ncbi:hypothetical protein NLG97_g6995 [Lecanicillium saksenae]|uniref:Uncharacterized protein n=1 Tax=Lecanicillium saksenae TaxID=468837 RepID=A0ACC1QPS0_9HYPO|nr:hypothetical protein NLG97_g6995 [Lecanicillium saksenae]
MKASPFTLFTLTAASVAAYTPCALIGSYFPPPSASSIKGAGLVEKFQAAFDKLVHDGGNEVYGPIATNTTSFSVIYFSGANNNGTRRSPSLFEYQYTSPYDVAHGLPAVTADTKFPLAEVTMVFTVYAWLLKMGSNWDEPITKFLTDLNVQEDNFGIRWQDITIGDLTGHTSGLVRSSSVCAIGKACESAAFLKDITSQGPAFLPHTTPMISYAAFQVLAMAIERYSKSGIQKYSQIMNEAIFKPLGMASTSFIARGEQAAIAAVSTTRDLAKAGNAMLSSELVSASTTRSWMQRSVDSSNLRNGVGYPWEIYRSGDATSPILAVLTKSGAIGSYASYFGVSPDLDVGFAILARDFTVTDGKLDLNVYADIASDTLRPLQKVAVGEMAAKYAGLFKSESGDALLLNVTGPGLEVMKMSEDGKNRRQDVADVSGIKETSLDFRLYPTNVRNAERHQYVAVFQDRDAPVDAGTPTCITWQDVGSLISVPNKFIFELNSMGVASSVSVQDGKKYVRV